MKNLFLSFWALALVTSSVMAQTKFSIEGGIVSSGYTVKEQGNRIFTADKIGGSFELGFDSKITNHIHAQTGLQYVMNGYMRNSNKGDLTYRVNTIQLPLNVIYKTEKADGNRLYFGIGPYFAVNIFGEKKYNPRDSTEFFIKTNIGSSAGDSLRMFDFGFGINGGYELKNGFFIRVHYQLGIANQSELNDESNVLRNRHSGISIGYLVGNSKDKRMQRRAFRNHGLEM